MRPLPRESRRHGGLAVAILLGCLMLQAPAVFAGDLGFFASRSLLSDADQALAAGRLEQAAELYARVAAGTDAGKGRHARALLGAAVAELGREAGDVAAAAAHLDAYLADPAAEQKPMARVLQRLLERTETGATEPEPPSPPPAADPGATAVGEGDAARQKARIAELERQLSAAKAEIGQKEKVIEELRKIVVEGGG